MLFTSGTTGLPEGDPDQPGHALGPPAHDDDRAVRPGRTADRRHDVRPDLPRGWVARSARRVAVGTDDRDPAPLRRRRVAPPRGEARDLVGVPRADHAPAHPRPSRLRDHRPERPARRSTTAPPPPRSSWSNGRWRRCPHVAFANIFGQTETLGAYTTLTPDDHFAPERIGSVGRALPGVEIRVVDPVTEQDVPAGEVGELWVLSDQNVRPGMAAHRRPRPTRRRRLHLPERPPVGHDQPRWREVRADRDRDRAPRASGRRRRRRRGRSRLGDGRAGGRRHRDRAPDDRR